MFHLLLLVIHLCIVGTISQTVIRGVVGQEITLPCTYSIRDGTTHMCWGQGSCPNSKCSNEILRTDGMRVTSRTSSRYQLRGWVTRGDVSLTIINLKEGDKGLYCCRIEVPGWFNDLKKTLNLQVDRGRKMAAQPATTTIRRTTTTTTAPGTTTTITVPITTTSAPLMTTVTPPTITLHLTTNPPPLAVPTVPPLTTNVSPVTTSSVKEAIEFLTSDPPFINIKPSTPSLQTTYGYNYNFLTTETEIATSAVTTSSPVTLLTPKGIENITNRPTSVPITAYPAATTNSSHTVAMPSAIAPLMTVAIPITSPILSPTTSSSPAVPAVALPIANVSSMTESSTSTAVALLTAFPPLVNTKSPSTSALQECTESGSSLTSEAVTSSTAWKMLSRVSAKTQGSFPAGVHKSGALAVKSPGGGHMQQAPPPAPSSPGTQGARSSQNHVAVSCAVTVLVLLMVLLVLIVKRKNMRLYQLNKPESVNQVGEPERMLIGTEGENGIFSL